MNAAGENNFSLSAFVFSDQNISRQTKSKDALNVFLNGIPPIEMSRCVPFLDVTIFYKGTESSPKYLNHAYVMRFTKKNGKFQLDDENASKRKRSSSKLYVNIYFTPNNGQC